MSLKNKLLLSRIMRVYNYSEAQLDLSAVLNTALSQDVIVRKQNGQRFKIIPVKENIRALLKTHFFKKLKMQYFDNQ